MPFKIRNKGIINITAQNSYRKCNITKPLLPADIRKHCLLNHCTTRYAPVRLMHGYRNISRAAKQFLLGDKLLEQIAIITIRNELKRPLLWEQDIWQNYYMIRTAPDLLDKHYGLVANNQHPLQLFIYEQHNKFLRLMNQKEYVEKEQTIDERQLELMEEKKHELQNAKGQKFTVEELSEIYLKTMEEYRATEHFSLRSKTKTGEINDYLEIRRPFGTEDK